MLVKIILTKNKSWYGISQGYKSSISQGLEDFQVDIEFNSTIINRDKTKFTLSLNINEEKSLYITEDQYFILRKRYTFLDSILDNPRDEIFYTYHTGIGYRIKKDIQYWDNEYIYRLAEILEKSANFSRRKSVREISNLLNDIRVIISCSGKRPVLYLGTVFYVNDNMLSIHNMNTRHDFRLRKLQIYSQLFLISVISPQYLGYINLMDDGKRFVFNQNFSFLNNDKYYDKDINSFFGKVNYLKINQLREQFFDI